jgi:GNAT superfamily N-acetyltransferase
MNNLSDYIFDYAINESMVEIFNNEAINENAIMNGIKKLWKWITRKNKKKEKENKSSSSYSGSYSGDVEDDNNDSEKTQIKIVDYEYSKLQQLQLSQEMKKSKEAVQKYADRKNDIKVIVAEDIKAKQIPAILVYVAGDKSPIAEQFEQFKNYAHIFALEVDPKYREKGLGRVLIKHAKEKLEANSTSQSKGFTINFTEAKSKELYNNIGFKEVFESEDKKVKIMYAKYEDIDTDH